MANTSFLGATACLLFGLAQVVASQATEVPTGGVPRAVTIVATPQQLKDAVLRGDEHIELREHLDMSLVEPVDFRILGILPDTVKSIRGNCTAPMPSAESLGLSGAPLLPAAESTCLVATDKDLLYAWHGSVWLDRLYMRLTRTERTDLPVLLHVHRSPAGALWATRCVLQGDGQGLCRALYADAAAFLADSTIADMGREEASLIVRSRDSSVSLHNCTFRAASPPPPPAPPEQHAPPIQAQVASAVRLEHVTFEGFGSIYPLLDSQGTSAFFGDVPMHVWNERQEEGRVTHSLEDHEAAGGRHFMSADDVWLRDVQSVLPTLPRRAAPAADMLSTLRSSLQSLQKTLAPAVERLLLQKLPGSELGKAVQAALYASALLLLSAAAFVCWRSVPPRKSKQS
eukprot:jgi/Ulvmu1/8790/UM048_0045.1